jgi:predicted aconitase with swiveling domain
VKMRIRCRGVVKGFGEGTAIVSRSPISFFGGVDGKTGRIIEKGHELNGEVVSGRVLLFPHGKGSTVGSYVIYAMAKNHVAPVAMINLETEAIIATGAVMGRIPLVHRLERDPFEVISNGDWLQVDADRDVITVQ